MFTIELIAKRGGKDGEVVFQESLTSVEDYNIFDYFRRMRVVAYGTNADFVRVVGRRDGVLWDVAEVRPTFNRPRWKFGEAVPAF